MWQTPGLGWVMMQYVRYLHLNKYGKSMLISGVWVRSEKAQNGLKIRPVSVRIRPGAPFKG